jgi:hypothetical protein
LQSIKTFSKESSEKKGRLPPKGEIGMNVAGNIKTIGVKKQMGSSTGFNSTRTKSGSSGSRMTSDEVE